MTKNHQLDTLAQSMSENGVLVFSDQELDLLYRLSPFMALGRYPVEKGVNVRNRNMSEGMETGGWLWPSDDELVARLFGRMFEEFQRQAKQEGTDTDNGQRE